LNLNPRKESDELSIDTIIDNKESPFTDSFEIDITSPRSKTPTRTPIDNSRNKLQDYPC